MTIYPKHLTTA